MTPTRPREGQEDLGVGDDTHDVPTDVERRAEEFAEALAELDAHDRADVRRARRWAR